MIACNSQATQGDLYMFSSPDKTTWTIMNSGNPVLTHNPSTASLFYNLLNPSILFVEDALYLAIEGRDAVGGWYGMGLASSTLVAGPSFDASLTQIIPVSGMAVNVIGGCNPDLHYLSNRGVFVLVGTVWVADYLNTAIWFASDDDNLFDGNSWTKTKFSFAHSGKYTTDTYLIELPAFFNHRLLLSYNYDQLATNSLRQALNETTLTELYDALVKNL